MAFDLSSLDGSNGFRLDGENVYELSGKSVSNAGDVNGDGFDDVIIGARGADPYGDYSGSSYVVFGRASGFDAAMDLSSLDGSNGFRLDGVAEGDKSGWSVSGAGDVNDDGFDDLIVGAPDADSNGDYSGSSYVVFGRTSGFAAAMDLSSLNGSNGFRLDGASFRDNSGYSVSNAGDVNGDGFDDVIVGGNTNSFLYGRSNSYVVFGKASGFDAQMNLSGLDGNNGFRLDETDSGGWRVSAAGDVNGDGFDDVIVGISGGDYYSIYFFDSYVVFGKAAGFDATLDLSSLDGSNGFRLSGARGGVHLNGSVSGAGDVNGDGFDDVIVSDGSGSYGSYVVFGRDSGFDASMTILDLDGSNGFRLDGGSSSSVSNAGDVNGDGFDDLLIGVPRGTFPGSTYVVFGKASGFDATMSLSSFNGNNGIRLDGVAERDSSGWSVSGAGDVNDDGFDDLLVGAFGADPNGESSGSSYVIFGSSDFGAGNVIAGTPGDDVLRGTSAAEIFEAGDGNDQMIGGGGVDVFHGDGGDDIIRVSDLDFKLVDGGVGSDTLRLEVSDGILNLADFNHTIDGIETINLIHSNNTTLTLTLPDLLSLSDTTDTFTVKGKANDRVVGLIDGWEDGGIDGDYHIYTNHGTVLRLSKLMVTDRPALNVPGVIHLADLNGSNGFSINGEAAYDYSGRSVSNAGDVNGDGFDDVIVGAPDADPNGKSSGSSYVVFGKASGFNAAMDLSSLDGSSGFRLDGGAKYDFSGGSVSSAGDVNGDGFDDVIFGASGADPNGKSSGSSYVVFGKVSGFNAAMDLSSLDGSNGFRLDGVTEYDVVGSSVSSAGDVNGDGFDDVIIGAVGVDPNGRGLFGSSYVVFGKASGFDAMLKLSGLDGSNGFRLDGVVEYDFAGITVSSTGDVNGDGFDDVIIGAVGVGPNGRELSGSSYVVFGKASGFAATLDLSSLDGNNGVRLDGVTARDYSGASVSGAGDVNGDGFDDLIVGAFGADLNGGRSGSSYVIFGSRDFGSGNGGGDHVIAGTPGDDVLKGTPGADIFEAGDGNDRMTGRGGADVFHGGAGDDFIQVADLGFGSVDGGSGNDTLHIDGKDLNLDLANFSDKIHGTETICLYGRGDNTLTLTAGDLLGLSDSGNKLRVNGNAGDHVTVLDDGWVDEGPRGSGYYHAYTHDDAVLLVGPNITVDFV